VTIRGKNDPDKNQIDVVVTLKTGKVVKEGDEFKYWIAVDGIGKLDPRVRVKDADLLQNMQYDHANALFEDAFGMSIQQLMNPPETE
jgi:hypothetical protein